MAHGLRSTILVVDDDPGLRDALHLVLDDDYNVIDAADGFQALGALAVKKIDLILLDLVMAHGDGFEVLERLRKEDKAIPTIVVSGVNAANTAATAMKLGAVDYVTKPFDEDALRELIRSALASPSTPFDRGRAQRTSRPVATLVGFDLGIYASLTVLLREQCRVMRAETIRAALTTSDLPSAIILLLDLTSPGQQVAISHPCGHVPNIGFITVHGGRVNLSSSITCTVLEAPVRVTDLLAAMVGYFPPSGSAGYRYSPRVGSILNRLGTQYIDASVQQLASAAKTSPDYLSASFREETGLPLKIYMTELRIEAAKWLLLTAGEKLETVAARVGLHDASHLSKLFVRYVGTRPGAYRRRTVASS